MNSSLLGTAALAALLAAGPAGCTARSAAVPATCTPEVNDELARLIDHRVRHDVYDVMVCGTTIAPSRPLPAGAHGAHQLIPLRVPTPDGPRLVEVVTNDDLDGVVTAPRGATVFAYGRYYPTTFRQRPFVAGIDDVHCATSRRADNGWVVVNGVRYPRSGCGA